MSSSQNILYPLLFGTLFYTKVSPSVQPGLKMEDLYDLFTGHAYEEFRQYENLRSVLYDIVSVADVLSQIDSVREDVRFIEMIQLIKNKQDENGLFTPESVFQKYKGWEFGQKKKPSQYLTYCCHLILERTGL